MALQTPMGGSGWIRIGRDRRIRFQLFRIHTLFRHLAPRVLGLDVVNSKANVPRTGFIEPDAQAVESQFGHGRQSFEAPDMQSRGGGMFEIGCAYGLSAGAGSGPFFSEASSDPGNEEGHD